MKNNVEEKLEIPKVISVSLFETIIGFFLSLVGIITSIAVFEDIKAIIIAILTILLFIVMVIFIRYVLSVKDFYEKYQNQYDRMNPKILEKQIKQLKKENDKLKGRVSELEKNSLKCEVIGTIEE